MIDEVYWRARRFLKEISSEREWTRINTRLNLILILLIVFSKRLLFFEKIWATFLRLAFIRLAIFNQKCEENEFIKKIKIFILSFDDRIKDKYLMFKSYIDKNKNQSSLINNENESEFLNESFAQKWNIETFKFAHENRVNLILKNDISFQVLTRETHVNLLIEKYRKRLFCYITQLKCDLI